MPGVVAHACNPRTLETKARGFLKVGDQFQLPNEIDPFSKGEDVN